MAKVKQPKPKCEYCAIKDATKRRANMNVCDACYDRFDEIYADNAK